MNKQARSINCNDIALFLYVEPVIDATRFERNRVLPVRYGTCSWDRQRVAARDGGDEPLRVAKGADKLFVSQTRYLTFGLPVEVTADMTARAELYLEPVPERN